MKGDKIRKAKKGKNDNSKGGDRQISKDGIR